MSSVGVMNMPQDIPQFPTVNGAKRKMEDVEGVFVTEEEGSKKVKVDSGHGQAASEGVAALRAMGIKKELCTASEQTGVSEEAVATGKGNSAAEATPSTSEVDAKEEGKGAAEDSHRSRRASETPPPAEEPRRPTARGASKKGGVNRAMNSKNFLKNILPNITRLSRTEVLYDLKVMDGTARIRVDRDRSAL